MEDGYKLWDELLKTVGVLTERLAKVKYKGIEAEFDLEKLRGLAAEAAPELTEEVVLNIDAASEKNHDNPDED